MNYRVHHFREVVSTNDLALEVAGADGEEGLVISADYQTRGRGRYERAWVAPRGASLLFSILLRPVLPVNQIPLLTHETAVAMKDALRSICPELELTLKKPNDILASGKKICGILVESQSTGQQIGAVVVGIGLNVREKISQWVAGSTSIEEETGRKVERNDILRQFIANFSDKYAIFNRVSVN